MAEDGFELLTDHLRALDGTWVLLSFDDLESIIGRPLSASARSYPSQWSNTGRWSRYWKDAGFRTTFRGIPEGYVAFVPEGYELVRTDEEAEARPAVVMGHDRISLAKLAFACRIYDAMTDYSRSLRSFRESVSDSVDLTDRRHRRALLDWLNAWTCRIDLESREQIAEDLAVWFGRHRAELPRAEDRLLGLSDTALEAFIDPFDQLSQIKPPDARRKFGPTAASKTLFALCPAVFVPWDALIREELVRGDSGAAYVKFLARMRDDLRTIAGQCSENGFDVDALGQRIGRPGTTAAQLIGEYYWITITRRARPPDAETLQRWARWS